MAGPCVQFRELLRECPEFRELLREWHLSTLKIGVVPRLLNDMKVRSAKTGFLANRVFACVTPAIFVIFVVFRALRSKALVFVDRVSTRHFRRFRQNPLFSVGGKDPVWLRPRFSLPEKAFSPKRGLIFTVNGASAPPPPPPPNSP